MDYEPGINRAVFERRKTREQNKKRREEGLDALKAEGNEAFKGGDYKKAISLYGSAIEKYGQKAPLCSNLAAAFGKLEMWKEADWAATLALKANPKMTKARFRRAMARKALKRWEASLRDLEMIVATDPTCKEAIPELEIVEAKYEQWLEDDEEDYDADSDYVNPANVDWPIWGQEPLDYESDSDTEDCRHKGNGVACRFYNHAGCFRGRECTYSHGPDDKSVRDEVGKNVCMRHLLGHCKFGANCIYSHDKRYLPPNGWWDKPDAQTAVSMTLDTLESPGFDAESCETFLYHLPYGRQTAKHALLELDNSRLRKAVEKAQKSTKKTTAPPLPSKAKASVDLPETGRIKLRERFVLVISLDSDNMFMPREADKPLLQSIKQKTGIREVFDGPRAIAEMASPLLLGVLVTDAGIAKRNHRLVKERLVQYVKDGGTAVIGCDFSNYIAGDDFAKLFQAFGLAWQRGSYHRTTHFRNTSNAVVAANPSLPPSYSLKALHADGITKDQIVYGPTSKSVTQSLVFAPERVKKFSEAPIVIANVGKGQLGYVGDVNAERESDKAYLAMLGLLDAPPPPSPAPAKVSATAEAGPSRLGTSSGAGAEVPASETGKGPTSAYLKAMFPNGTTKAPAPTTSTSKSTTAKGGLAPTASNKRESVKDLKDRCILVALLDESHSQKFLKTFAQQLTVLRSKAKVETVFTRVFFELQLSQPDKIRGVYIADAAILKPENQDLLAKLAQYVRGGGKVVAGGLFPSTITVAGSKTFFSTFGLNWVTSRTPGKAKAVYELGCPLSGFVGKNPTLPDMFSARALRLKTQDDSYLTDGVYAEILDSEDEFDYRDDEDSEDEDEIPCDAAVLHAKVSKGSVGFIGDVDGDTEVTPVVLAMFGLLHPENEVVVEAPRRKSKPFVMIMAWDTGHEDLTETVYRGFLEPLKTRVETIHRGLSMERMTDLVSSPDLLAVLVASANVADEEEGYLRSKLAEFVQGGGTVIFLDGFAQEITTPECKPFFQETWGLDWNIARNSYPVEKVEVNVENVLIAEGENELPSSDELDLTGAHTFATSNPDDLVYVPRKRGGLVNDGVWNEKTRSFVGPVLLASVGEKGGKVGFVGCVSPDEDYARIVNAMVGL